MKNSKVKELVGMEEIKEQLLDIIEDELGELVDNSIDEVLDSLRIDNQIEQELNEKDEDYLIEIRNSMISNIIEFISEMK
ncbi:MAG: hypothetical protein ACRDDY_07980 [Clostridium sp.]|uniref:hypothetical protein n=1 Tax=Clostridium sp. TaxID=1506 RepID=UPI003EE49005